MHKHKEKKSSADLPMVPIIKIRECFNKSTDQPMQLKVADSVIFPCFKVTDNHIKFSEREDGNTN